MFCGSYIIALLDEKYNIDVDYNNYARMLAALE